MSSFFGVANTESWGTGERPESYREMIIQMPWAGDVPMTALMTKAGKTKVNDPQFHWWEQETEEQGGTASFSGSYAVGSLVTATVTAAVAGHFRTGHTVVGIDISTPSDRFFGKVMTVVVNGASSTVSLKLLAATTAAIISAADYISIVGDANPENGTIPTAISYLPTKYTNYTQIFRTPLSISRTQQLTKLRTGDAYQRLKADVLKYHGIAMEQALLFGVPSEDTSGSNGLPERTTGGLLYWLSTYASSNIRDFSASTGLTWEQAGEEWLDESLELVFRKGRSEKLALCDSGALLGMMKLAKASGQYTYEAGTVDAGIKVMRYHTPFGTLNFKLHPLMSNRNHLRNQVLIYEPQNLKFNYITDTIFKKDDGQNVGGNSAYDGKTEEYLTEGGFEIHLPETAMHLTNFGNDGTA